jgi:hypothetical protein
MMDGGLHRELQNDGRYCGALSLKYMSSGPVNVRLYSRFSRRSLQVLIAAGLLPRADLERAAVFLRPAKSKKQAIPLCSQVGFQYEQGGPIG